MNILNDCCKHILNYLHDGVYVVDRERRIVYWSKGAERITGYTSDEVVGNKCSHNILMHVDRNGTSLCEGTCPLTFTMEDGITRETEVFLRHKKGHRVPVSVRTICRRNEEGVSEGAIEIFSDNTQKAMLERAALFEELAYLDPLTGIANRRFTEMTLQSRIDEMRRYGWQFGILFLDVDRFKNVNDRYGHAVGDEILKMIAKTLSNTLRSFDFAARWGGEEFLAILTNVDADDVKSFANRIRALVEQSSLSGERRVGVTVSIGGTLARPVDTVSSLVERADSYMYRSKKAGRNCVTVDE